MTSGPSARPAATATAARPRCRSPLTGTGPSWTDVEVPRVSNRHHALNDVVVISHDDVWAVGDYRNVADVFRGVTYHWDGTAWSHVHSPIEDVAQKRPGRRGGHRPE